MSESRPRLGLVALNSGVPHLLKLVDDGAVGGLAVGGIEVQVVALARALAARGWDTTLLVGDWGQTDEVAQVDGIKVVRACRRGRSRLRRALTAVQLAESLRRLPVDVCLMQGIHGAVGVGAFCSHLSGKRFVFWLASNTDATFMDRRTSRLSPSQRRLAAYGLRHADALIAQTQDQQRLVEERLRRESTVIPNVWPMDALRAGRAGRPTALWVANIRWEKRPEMVPELARAVPEMQFVMVGGPMAGNEALYEQVLARQREVPNFHYAGFVPFDQVGSWFEQADIFINTSVVEGFPNTFLQAWDAELPIVATFDPDGVLSREGLGHYCQNPEQFADRLRELMADEPRRRALGLRGKQYLRDNFSPEVVIPRLEELLQRVADEGRIHR